MTLLTAVIFGIGTGLRVKDRRRRLLITAIAVAVALPIQTLALAYFVYGVNGLSTPAYWVVQVFVLMLGLLMSEGVARLRRRAVA